MHVSVGNAVHYVHFGIICATFPVTMDNKISVLPYSGQCTFISEKYYLKGKFTLSIKMYC